MIERITIGNFKSLAGFSLAFSKFNCLVGMNGAGKSTVLQAIDFIAQLMEGRISEWLEMREWTVSELNCKLRSESNISLVVAYRLRDGRQLHWVATFNRHELQCSSETILVPRGGEQLRVRAKGYRLEGGPKYRSSSITRDRFFRNFATTICHWSYRSSVIRCAAFARLSCCRQT
jgi:predicted ATPase